jgi:hypothetical protein
MDNYRPMGHQDAADSPLSSYWEDAASKMDENEAAEFLSFVEHYDKELTEYMMRGMAEGLRYALVKIWERDNQALAIKAFFIAAGFTSVVAETLDQVADNLGITKQAVSKEVTFFRDLCGFRALGAAKSEQAREACREGQLAKEYKETKTYGTFDQFYHQQQHPDNCAI